MSRSEPLHDVHREYIAQEISRLVLVAADERNAMRDVAYDLIDRLIWRWTADGYDREANVVRYDARKLDFDSYPHTHAARTRAASGDKGVRHEHVVPKRVLIGRLLRGCLNADATKAFLDRFCIVALVLKDEEEAHIPQALRKAMPTTFSFADPRADVWARYRPPPGARTGLYDLLVFPGQPK
jgi:hypothetical protein